MPRFLLAVPTALVALVALSGCTDSMSCKGLNERQDADAARTCVASMEIGDDPITVSLADGTTLTVDGAPRPAWTFDDGVRLGSSDGVVAWKRDGQTLGSDSVGQPAGFVTAAPVGDRYAVPLASGRLLLRSRDGSDPVDVPIEIKMETYGDIELASDVRTAFSADGKRFAAADGGRTAFAVDARTGERLWEAPLDTTARAIALSADGSLVAVALRDGSVRVWDVASGAEIGHWSHPKALEDVTFGADGSLLAWIGESTSTRRENIYKPNGTHAPGVNQTREVTDTHRPRVVVWRLP